jgi:mannose-6-phosphate isomerase
LRRALNDGSIENCLHSFEPQPGDCVFIPAGTVHALGAGLLVAEIQQASDTTYRLYDWGRTGPDGKPRPLHIEQALAVIDYSAIEIKPQRGQKTKKLAVECLVRCDKFVLDRWNVISNEPLDCGDQFQIISVLAGELDISSANTTVSLSRGQTALLPACLGEMTLVPRPDAAVLAMHLP